MRIVLLTLCTWLMAASAVQATELQWWSHWAIEDNKKVVLFEAKRQFEAKNPGHTVTITFYEKKNMFTTLRAAFTAGSGFPDVVY
jgi:ABC-type glycerol-3-phosphate transport system substrate-binding protein